MKRFGPDIFPIIIDIDFEKLNVALVYLIMEMMPFN
jgi:hypothetical protein